MADAKARGEPLKYRIDDPLGALDDVPSSSVEDFSRSSPQASERVAHPEDRNVALEDVLKLAGDESDGEQVGEGASGDREEPASPAKSVTHEEKKESPANDDEDNATEGAQMTPESADAPMPEASNPNSPPDEATAAATEPGGSLSDEEDFEAAEEDLEEEQPRRQSIVFARDANEETPSTDDEVEEIEPDDVYLKHSEGKHSD
ncbi:unnamed protein product, partial [Symbiodinium sp. KB8]